MGGGRVGGALLQVVVCEKWEPGLVFELRRIDSFITQLKAQGPSRTCNESQEEEEEEEEEEEWGPEGDAPRGSDRLSSAPASWLRPNGLNPADCCSPDRGSS